MHAAVIRIAIVLAVGFSIIDVLKVICVIRISRMIIIIINGIFSIIRVISMRILKR